MTSPLLELAERYRLNLTPALLELAAAFPQGADLGTLRLLPPEEMVREGALPIPLLPIAEGGPGVVFALFVPPEPAAESKAVCAVDLERGFYAPVSASVKGFVAYALALRQAQASLPDEPAFPLHEVLEETARTAAGVGGVFGLQEMLASPIEPDALAIAQAVRRHEPASPWAASILAQAAPDPRTALTELGPALAAVPFSAGLLEQAGELLLELEDTGRAARSLWSALARLEPNLQAAPYRLGEPETEEGRDSQAFQPLAAFYFLRETPKEIPPEARASGAWTFLSRLAEDKPGCGASLDPAQVVEFARRRAYGGDPQGARWVLHLALASCWPSVEAARPVLTELSALWELAGSPWYARRSKLLAEAGT